MDVIRFYEVELERVVRVLREYFNRLEDIELVILFGSILRRRFVRDVDVAVYSRKPIELKRLLLMGAELEEILGVPVDLVPLKELPPEPRLRVLRDGLPVIVRSSSVYTELLKESMGELEDLEIVIRTSTGRRGKQ